MALGDDVLRLLDEQSRDWPMLAEGIAALGQVRTRGMNLPDFSVRLQCNPRRIVSSGAKTDAASIAQRRCFLCPSHLPAEQRGIAFASRYLILCNPFPIAPIHFTVPILEHVDQRIAGRLGDMLKLSRELGDRFFTLYNGPRCGASAPDHFHFQACGTGFLPIESQIDHLVDRFGVADQSSVTAVRDPHRPFYLIESASAAQVERGFDVLMSRLPRQDGEAEPMMNLLCWWVEDRYRLVVFPRRRHRPASYFLEGEARRLLSPGSIDLGGVVVTPVESDFDRLTEHEIVSMFKEVCGESV
jgi:hypothetical protein